MKLIEHHRHRAETITADDGTEVHGYKEIELASDVTFYFATPHHSYERRTIENTNGLIRQRLPKRRSIAGVAQHQCTAMVE